MTNSSTTFETLGVANHISSVISDLGYETPTPIQEQGIPILMQGNDLLAQAQTGTGKTAAFALPILTKIDLDNKHPQALVLAPTRELAIQVAEAFQSYAKQMKGLHVLPIYGGSDFRNQLRALERGVHVVVGTPGRVMDHMRRKTLRLDAIDILVLDEADEMLKMGFIDDIEWILQQIPGEHQTACFSATMPPAIKKVADKYLHNAQHIKIKSKTKTVEAIKQFYTVVSNNHKLEALTRFLEVQETDAAIIFTRTKNTSSEIADKLAARGYAAAAINGDLSQDRREKVIKKLKNGSLDIVVATDVAARGLDVERISHVINYDIPHDCESYVHRIGRTGRAGREGTSILFVAPREKRMLSFIERDTKQAITPLDPPSVSQINTKRREDFSAKVLKALESEDLDNYRELIETLKQASESSELDIAAALAFMAQKKTSQRDAQEQEFITESDKKERGRGSKERRRPRGDRPHGRRNERSFSPGSRRRSNDSERRGDRKRDGNDSEWRSERRRSESNSDDRPSDRKFSKRKEYRDRDDKPAKPFKKRGGPKADGGFAKDKKKSAGKKKPGGKKFTLTKGKKASSRFGAKPSTKPKKRTSKKSFA